MDNRGEQEKTSDSPLGLQSACWAQTTLSIFSCLAVSSTFHMPTKAAGKNSNETSSLDE